ncbi:hypothetical protein Krac_9960 [Ktedonobacter racemifer DSM 44963]|uniref:Uncharacterized protein n=1 Tax=Ktedonobacter racemifer DSM 44963 TaxID=485913 RepID=D6TEN7_KTERA|nr:hypothetical protein Krac_9960 [Ktedonobacter racemifer DSM 44963]
MHLLLISIQFFINHAAEIDSLPNKKVYQEES